MASVYTEVQVREFRKHGAANAFKVPVKQWRKWPEVARRVFNLHFYELKENQAILTHPKTQKVSAKEWRTQAWNSAWLAADSVVSALRTMSGE